MPASKFLPLSLSILVPILSAQTLPPASGDGTYVTLGKVQVSAAPFGARTTELLTSVTVIGVDQLENESVDYPLELLNKIPGLYLTDFNQGIITADVSMRGFNGQGSSPHLRLLVDGVPHNLNDGYNDLGAVFPLEIERVEVVKGTADPRFGLNAVAGTLQVRTHHAFVGQKLKVMAGDFGTVETQGLAGFRHGGFSQTYFAGYRTSEGYRDHSALSKHSFAGKWFYTAPAAHWRLGLSARVHEFKADAPGYLTRREAELSPTASPAFSASDGGLMKNEQFSLHGDAEITDEFTTSATLYHHESLRRRFVRFTASVAQQERVADENHQGASLTGRWKPSATAWPLVIDGGFDHHRQDALNQRFATVTRTRTATSRNHHYTLDNVGGFLGADLRPASWLRVIGAVRADQFDGDFVNRANGTRTPILEFGTIWQPKLSVSLQPHRLMQLYASYGRAFQIGAGAGAYGREPLDASKNDGYEAGLHITPRPGVTLRAALWRQTATDEVRLKPDNSGDSENVGETKREGADFEMSWRVHQRLTLWAAYTVQKGRFMNPGRTPADLALRGREINHVPHFTLKSGVDLELTQALALALSVMGQGDYHLLPANNTEQFGDYTLVNADLRYRWRNATLGLHVKNVGDKRHSYVWNDGVESLFSPGDPRAFMASVSFDF